MFTRIKVVVIAEYRLGDEYQRLERVIREADYNEYSTANALAELNSLLPEGATWITKPKVTPYWVDRVRREYSRAFTSFTVKGYTPAI